MANMVKPDVVEDNSVALDFLNLYGQLISLDELSRTFMGRAVDVQDDEGRHLGLLVFLPSVMLSDRTKGK